MASEDKSVTKVRCRIAAPVDLQDFTVFLYNYRPGSAIEYRQRSMNHNNSKGPHLKLLAYRVGTSTLYILLQEFVNFVLIKVHLGSPML